MSAEYENSRSRRPRPEERTIYRPGSGPLKKSSGNVENIRPDSSPLHSTTVGGDGGTQNIVSGMRNVTLNNDRDTTAKTRKADNVSEHSESTHGSRQKQIHPKAGERDNFKSKSGANGWNTQQGKQNQVNNESGGSTKVQHKTDTEPVQDLRQVILEKRSQRSKANSPSGSQRDRSNTSQPRSHTSGNNDHRQDRYRNTQPATSGRNGSGGQNHSHHNPSASNGAESWGRDTEQRKGPAKRGYKDQRPQRVMENSRSEGHLSSLSSNPVSSPSAEVEHKKFTEPTHVPAGRGRNNSDRKEGESNNRKKRRNGNNRGGSRRGSVSSDVGTTTPLPEIPTAQAEDNSRPPSRADSIATAGIRNNQKVTSPSNTGGKPVTNDVSPSLYYARNRSPIKSPSFDGQPSAQHNSRSHQQTDRSNAQPSMAYGRDQRSSGSQHQADYTYRNAGGRPPSGRGGHSRPTNYESLPPRLRKKYEDEQRVQHHYYQSVPPAGPASATKVESEWDGGSLTFVGSSSSRRDQPSQPLWSENRRGQPNRVPPSQDQEEIDHYQIRPRSQESSMTGIGLSSSLNRERKTSFNDSRSSTPSSNVDSGSTARGSLRRLDSGNGLPQTSLDWSEEMEEEDRRSMAGETKAQQQQQQYYRPPVQHQPPPIVFPCMDVRYKNKPIQGYTVLPEDDTVKNGTDAQPPSGRALLGPGRVAAAEPPPVPRLTVPGIIQLPTAPPPPIPSHPQSQRYSPRRSEGPRQHHHHLNNNNDSSRNFRKTPPGTQQRTLFDPANPHKPIAVVAAQRDHEVRDHLRPGSPIFGCPEAFLSTPSVEHGGSSANNSSKPAWYDPDSDSFRDSKSEPHLLIDIARCDFDLTRSLQGSNLIHRFQRIQKNREFLLASLKIMLTTDLRFCQNENVEQHIWKLAFHNVIEALRKAMSEEAEVKEDYRVLLFKVIDEGSAYFESLMETLQEAHHFTLDPYLEPQAIHSLSGLRYVGLAVISCQKILVFLGDLARYREITAETNNYGKAKSWYTKANLANPKNGRPYNQLAILALYARRKLDAVYLYMRSLMASNPFQSARESLVSLFDENRKKYEQQEKKRREAKEASSRRPKEPSSEAGLVDHRRGLRREIWIHPQDGRRTRRTTSTSGGGPNDPCPNSDDEELALLPSIEVNKRFVTSYLNVQGKLYTKIGMETFQECGLQMLREFRALLQQTPLPVNQTRLLQLLALNMFAVSNTQLKDTRMADGCRSAWQECALIVSLEMFNILLERCNALLKEQLESGSAAALAVPSCRLLGEDLQIILPAIKVWCDWLLCHIGVWNPPPTSRDYHVGPPGTPWTRLAVLFNLLSRLKTRVVEVTTQPQEGYEVVKLPEDVTLCGFTPLMVNTQTPHYTPKSSDLDLAADCVRIERMLYFGRDILCGLDPPVLKLKFIGPSLSEYVCVVDGSGAAGGGTTGQPRSGPTLDPKDEEGSEDEALLDELLNLEEEEEEGPEGLRQLRQRKEQLTREHQDQERRKQQLRAILQERVQVELEVRPKFLVADTNCYIDHLDAMIRLIRDQKHYILIAPLVVLNELDGLSRSRLSSEARAALAFLRAEPKCPQIRYVTSKGVALPPSAAMMSEESDMDQHQSLMTNDDRILQCCLGLINSGSNKDEDHQQGSTVRLLKREVVLLTEDRNLRVKALSRDVPVRDLPAFLTWFSSPAQH